MSAVPSHEFYDQTAEFVAVLLPQNWAVLGPAVAEALSEVDAESGPIVDVGAGSGLGTEVMARTLPGARIVAVEPHPALRTALFSRVAADRVLSDAVTVLGEDFLAAALPSSVSAFVAMNVVGHFDAQARDALWARMARHLAPGGRVLVNLSPPFEPIEVPTTPMADVRVGTRRYVGTASARPDGPHSIRWLMSYQVFEGDIEIYALSAEDEWFVLGPDELAAETAAHGLRLSGSDAESGLHVLTREK